MKSIATKLVIASIRIERKIIRNTLLWFILCFHRFRSTIIAKLKWLLQKNDKNCISSELSLYFMTSNKKFHSILVNGRLQFYNHWILIRCFVAWCFHEMKFISAIKYLTEELKQRVWVYVLPPKNQLQAIVSPKSNYYVELECPCGL